MSNVRLPTDDYGMKKTPLDTFTFYAVLMNFIVEKIDNHLFSISSKAKKK